MGLQPTENLLRWHSNLFFRGFFFFFWCHYKKSYSHYTSNLTVLSQHERQKLGPSVFIEMQGLTYHQDIHEDWKMTAECDVCPIVISGTPDHGSSRSNILNSNNEPIKENFQLLSFLPIIQRTQFNSLSNHIKEWKKNFCYEQVLKCIWRQRTQSGST